MTLNAPPTSPRLRTISLAWALVLVLVAGGAAAAGTAIYYAAHPTPTGGGVGATTNSTTPKNSTISKNSTAPRDLNLTDDLGRSVEVPIDPARVAVLSPSIMDIMYRLGLRSHVVGVDCYAAADGGLGDDYSPDQVALWNLSSSMCVQIGPEFAPETLVNLTPQLVLASTIVSVAEVEQITSNLGIPVVMLQPPTLSGVLVDVSLVGEIFNVSSVGDTLNARLSTELYNATNFTSQIYTYPTVLVTYSVDTAGYWTFGPGTFGQSLIELAGGASISANSTGPYPELAPAQVLVDDPTFIIYGTGFGLNESTYASGPEWSEFGAVVAGNVTGIDSNYLTEPDPTMILSGIPALIAALYPDGA